MNKFFLAAFLTFSFAAYSYAADMDVISKKPLAKAGKDVNSVSATFSRPSVSLTSLSKAGENCPLRVYEGQSSDPLPGKCRWQGTQTVVFEPASPFKISSLYRAEIKSGVKSADGKYELSKDVSWSFETPRQELLESAPNDGQRWVREDSALFLAFKYPVKADNVDNFVVISEEGTGKAISFSSRNASPEEIKKLWQYYDGISPESSVAILPKGLEKGKKYVISVKEGLPAAGASLGMEQPREITFETIYPLEAMEGPNGFCMPYNPEFKFSNPVRYGEFIKNIKITPEVKFETSDSGSFSESYDGATYLGENHAFLRLPSTALKPATKYTVTISAELSDIFGQKLGKDKTFSFRTGDICPSVNAHGGFGVLESYYPLRHPVETVNAGEIYVQKLALSKDNFIPFYKKGHQNLPAAAFASSWNPGEGLKNTKVYTFLDFAKVQEYANAGFFYAKLKIKDNGEERTETIWDNATDLGVTIKTSPDNILLWVTRLKTGKPAQKVSLQLRNSDNKVLWNGVTDKDGVAVAPGLSALPIKDWKRWENPEIWVFADSYKGTAVLNSAWNSGIEPWRFNIDYEYSPSKITYGASVFSDRGIYRTGEKVNIKGFLRKLSGGDWQAAGVSGVRVSLYDSRDNRIYSSAAKVSDSSSFSHSFVIPEGAPSGLWKYSVDEDSISAEDADKRLLSPWNADKIKLHFEGDFRVEDYKPAAFEVKAVPVKKDLFLGDKFEGLTDAKYLSGASMAGAKTEWNVRLDQSFFEPKGWKGYSFDTDSYENFDGVTVASGVKKLSSKGTLKTSVNLPKNIKGSSALRLEYEAGITAPDGQNLFARGYAAVHRSGLYIGVKHKKYYTKAGSPKEISFVAVHPDGKPFPGREIKLETGKNQWIGSRRAGLGGRLEWVSEKQETILDTKILSSTKEAMDYSFTPQSGGSYFFRLSGKDEKGRTCEIVSTFYVEGKDAWWMQEDNDILDVTPEKEAYKAGETAKLFVKSPWENAQALITVEREGIMDSFVRKIEAGASVIEIPVKDNYIPNAYVSVVLVQGRTAEPKCNKDKTECSDLGKPQGRFGYAHFAVKPENRGINTLVKADKEEYRPGDTVKITVKTTDENGNPVSAETAISAADEGVLALTSWKTPDIFSAFYGSRPLYVKTADNRLHIIGQRSYGEKGEKRGGGGGMGVSGLDLRSNFKPSAYWNPSVKTGKDGTAVVSFKVPDNLTRFRISAVSAAGRRFGSGETYITVNKPLMLRPILPSFARTGDSFACGVLVQNFSASSMSGTLSSSVSGAVSGAKLPEKFSVGSGASKTMSGMCNASEKTGKAVFEYAAQAKNEKDGLLQRIDVKEHKNWEYNYVSGVIDGNSSDKQMLEIPYEGSKGQVSFEVSNTITGGLKGTEDYIMSYPYPSLDAVLAQAQVLAGRGKLTEAANLINTLAEYQTAEGGFSYWKGGRYADPYITASFIQASLPLKKNSAFRMSSGFDKAKTWLSAWVRGDNKKTAYSYSSKEEMTAKANAVYVLSKAGVSIKDRIASLYSSRNNLSLEGKAWLLRAMKSAGYDQKAAKNIQSEILSSSEETASSMYFAENEELPWLHSSKAKTTAIVLASMLEDGTGFAGDQKAVMWLAMERKAKDYWRNIPENIYSWQALKAYSSRYEKSSAQQKITLEAAGAKKIDVTLGGNKKNAEKTADFAEIFKNGAKTEATLKKTGQGRAYYGYRMKFLAQPRTEAAKEGFEIIRTVKPVSGKTLKAGDKALVTITVRTAQDRLFVAVNSPVPAGFEIVNAALSTSGGNALRKAEEQYNYGFEHSEIYSDRIVLMADFLPAGEHTYTYLVQAAAAGDYFVPSARAECIYEPEIFGEDAASRQKINP